VWSRSRATLAVDATGQIRQPGACTRAKMVAAHLTTTQTVFWPLRWLFPWVASNPQPVIGAEIRIVLTKLSQGLQFTTNATSNTYVASDAVLSNIRGMFVAMKPNLQLEAALAAKYAAGQSVVKVSERCFTFRGSSTTATAWTDNWSLSCPPLRAYAFLVDANAFSATAATAALANQTNFLASGLQNCTFRVNSDVFPERSYAITLAASTIGSVAAQDAARALYSFIDVSGNEQVPVDADQFASIYPCIAVDFTRSPDMFLSKGLVHARDRLSARDGHGGAQRSLSSSARRSTRGAPAGQNKFVITQ
jgi:hypothetical protein